MEFVAVIGAVHSGTSATTAAVHYLGVPMLLPYSKPAQRLARQEQISIRYPYGFLEDEYFYNWVWECTDGPGDISTHVDGDDYYGMRLRSRYRVKLSNAELVKLRPWIKNRAQHAVNERWGLKNTRLMLVLEAIIPELQALGQTVRVIHVDRPIAESVTSLLSYPKEKVKGNQQLWASAVQTHAYWRVSQCLEAVQALAIPTLTVQFNELLEQKEIVVARIANFLGLPLTQAAIETVRSRHETHPQGAGDKSGKMAAVGSDPA